MDKILDMSSVPEVVYDRRPDLIELYQKAWQLAYEHVLDTPGLPVERHMDEAFAKDRLWIWDTCFMVHFCKYSPKAFPGIESLDNFYLPMHDGFKSSCQIHHPDNPPLFAWIEYEYYLFTGDTSRIRRNLIEKQYLQKHYEYFETARVGERYAHSQLLNAVQKNECGYLWSGIASGMDNTPRGNDIYCIIYWLDAIAQQALSALCISKMARIIGEEEIAKKFDVEYAVKKQLINQYYFSEEDGCYYDIYSVNFTPCPVLTPASFWPLMAEVSDGKRAASQTRTLEDPQLLGGEVPLVTVARNSKHFCDHGRYWRGAVWLPTAYMALKAVEKYGYLDLAADAADKILDRMSNTYQEFSPATIWECYSPTENKPATTQHGDKFCRPDFCGWSALGPISMLIENVLGFYRVNAGLKTVWYHPRDIGRHGIKGLTFGGVRCDILIDNGEITVDTNEDMTLMVGETKYACAAGQTKITLS